MSLVLFSMLLLILDATVFLCGMQSCLGLWFWSVPLSAPTLVPPTFVPYTLHCRLWTTINVKPPEAYVVIFMSLPIPHMSALQKVHAPCMLIEFSCEERVSNLHFSLPESASWNPWASRVSSYSPSPAQPHSPTSNLESDFLASIPALLFTSWVPSDKMLSLSFSFLAWEMGS